MNDILFTFTCFTLIHDIITTISLSAMYLICIDFSMLDHDFSASRCSIFRFSPAASSRSSPMVALCAA